jgi:hypothetical protein
LPVENKMIMAKIKYGLVVILLITGIGYFLFVKKPNDNKRGDTVNLSEAQYCSYRGTAINDEELKNVFLFSSDARTQNSIAAIMKVVGIMNKFEVKASDMPYAAAVVSKGKRIIYYNQSDLHLLENKLSNKYAPLSILAHEIGHHVEGHTLSNGGSQPSLEIEADRFSGHVLARMGATLEQACAAINEVCEEKSSTTHPGKRTRLAALTNGWMEARQMINQSNDSDPWLSHDVSPNSLYKINIDKRGITLRSRSLSPQEFKLANQPGQQGALINNSTIVSILYDGELVELLSTVGSTYYIRTVRSRDSSVQGYIAKKVSGHSTLMVAD